jgi:hypothetical protein
MRRGLSRGERALELVRGEEHVAHGRGALR